MSPVKSPQYVLVFSLLYTHNSIPHTRTQSSLPFLSISDIVKLDMPVSCVSGHDNPPGLDLNQSRKKRGVSWQPRSGRLSLIVAITPLWKCRQNTNAKCEFKWPDFFYARFLDLPRLTFLAAAASIAVFTGFAMQVPRIRARYWRWTKIQQVYNASSTGASCLFLSLFRIRSLCYSLPLPPSL